MIKLWIVYNREDSWEHGFEVPTETEAIEYCRNYQEFTYTYVYLGEMSNVSDTSLGNLYI